MASLAFFVRSQMLDRRGNPRPFPSYNEHENLARTNRHLAARQERELVDLVARTARVAADAQGWRMPEAPVRVTLVWHEVNRRRDQDGIRWFEKPLLDGLQKAGVIANDNQGCIDGFSRNILQIDRDNPGVGVYLDALEGRRHGE